MAREQQALADVRPAMSKDELETIIKNNRELQTSR